MENTQLNDTRLSPHFRLGEFLNLGKYSDNIPTMQHLLGQAADIRPRDPKQFSKLVALIRKYTKRKV